MEQILSDVKKTFYPRLILYGAIAEFHSGIKQSQPSTDPVTNSRRHFLDSFSYLCDFEKGGKTVTAAALQKLPRGNILWLAANEGIRHDVEAYARDICRSLINMEPESKPVVRDHIFQRAVQFCTPRLAFYKGLLRKHARNCRMQLGIERQRQEGRNHVSLSTDVTKLSSEHSSSKAQEAF